MSLALKYDTSFIKNFKQQSFFMCGARIAGLIKLLYKANKFIRETDSGAIRYMQCCLKKGDTVLNISEENPVCLYYILKKLNGTGKVINLEPSSFIYDDFLLLRSIYKWQNVVVEPTINNEGSLGFKPQARVIDFKMFGKDNFKRNKKAEILDEYCAANNIQPDFIKIDTKKINRFTLSEGIETIKKYRPRIMLICEERLIGKQAIIEIFKFLNDLNYSGYFFLDDLRIPLINFDFNIYQNSSNDFYCSNFIFE